MLFFGPWAIVKCDLPAWPNLPTGNACLIAIRIHVNARDLERWKIIENPLRQFVEIDRLGILSGPAVHSIFPAKTIGVFI